MRGGGPVPPREWGRTPGGRIAVREREKPDTAQGKAETVNGKTVLLVDDDHSILSFAASAIFEAGYQALFANNGRDALRMLEEMRPDMIFLEINTSKVDGWNLCATIRTREYGANVPIVLTSRVHSQEKQLKTISEEQGANGYLVKPFGVGELLREVERHLGEVVAAPETADQDGETLDPEGIQALLHGAMVEVPSAGSVPDRPVALLLGEVVQGQRSGFLWIGDGKDRIVIYLEFGRPVCARSNLPSYRLGEILKRSGKITVEQHEHALQMVRQFGGARWIEEILVGLAYITPRELADALNVQLHGLLTYAVYKSGRGARFLEEEIPVPEEIHVEVDPLPLIFHAVKTVHDPRRLLPHFPARDDILIRRNGGGRIATSLTLTGFEQEILNLVDGARTFGELCTLGGRTLGSVETLLMALLAAGILLPKPAPRGAHKERPEWAIAGDGVVLSGDLAKRPFSSVLKEIHQSGQTGVLVLERNGVRKWIHFRDGEVVFARSTQPDDRIGRVLVEANLVPEAAVEEAARESGPDKGRRIGGVLLDKGLISFEQLYWAGIFQVQNIVQSLYTWKSGRFVFKARQIPSYANVSLPLSTIDFLLEAARSSSLDALERSEGLSADAVLIPAEHIEEMLETVRLSEIEEGIMAWLSGETQVAELLDVGLGEAREVLLALHALRTAGLVHRKAAPRAPTPGRPHTTPPPELATGRRTTTPAPADNPIPVPVAGEGK